MKVVRKKDEGRKGGMKKLRKVKEGRLREVRKEG